MSTATKEQIADKAWLDNLKYCICGYEVLDTELHKGCVVSGITRGIFTSYSGWKEYCLENGKRVSDYYSNNIPHFQQIPGQSK